MVHSIELVFDDATAASLRASWDQLAADGIPSQAPASRPHVTLTVADRIGEEVDVALQTLAGRLPFECVVGAPVLFGRSTFVLARLIVPTAELLALHADVGDRSLPHMLRGPYPNAVPGEWTAHVTLARRVGGAQLWRALRIASRPSQLRGTFTGLRRWDGGKRAEHLIGG